MSASVQAARRTAAHGRRWAPASRVVRLGLLVAVAVLFGVSGGLLWLLGYNYDGLSGNPATKIHPFTYIVVALFAWRVIASGDPVGTIVRIVERRPGTTLLGLSGVLLLVVTLARKGAGLAGFVDTFIGPALLVVLLAEADERALERITVLLHVLMTANAVMALGEIATQTPLFPYRLDGAVFPSDLRASALQGHPLVNASITACYVLALMSGSRSLPASLRVVLIGLQCAALVAFGGRSGVVVTLVFGGVYLIVVALRSLRRGRVPLLGAALGVVLLTLVPIAVGIASTAGFFDTILGRFASDGGSANARVEMFALVRALPLRDLIVGPDIGLVESLRRINGLEWGIENPVIRLLLYQGGFLTAVVMVAVVWFMIELTREREPGIWIAVIACLILLNTAESIGSKTTLLAKFAVILVCLYRRVPARVGRPAVRPAAGSAPVRQ